MRDNALAQRMVTRAVSALVTAALVLQAPLMAFAAVGKAEGVDYWYDDAMQSVSGEIGSNIEILQVTGDDDDIVYLDVHKDGTQIASHLTFQVKDLRETENGASSVIAIALAKGLEPKSTYQLIAYTDRNDALGSMVFSGTIQLVYGSFEGTVSPIAVRTVSDVDPDAFVPHDTYVKEGTIYELESTTPLEDPDGEGRTIYAYKLPSEAPATITGTVRYVDSMTGTLIKSDEYTLERGGEKQLIEIPKTFEQDGKTYRTLFLKGGAVLSYSGRTSVTVNCHQQDVDDGFFTAYISYVDEDGNDLSVGSSGGSFVHELPVFRTTTYTPPRYIYIPQGGTIATYKLAEANPYLDMNGILRLEPGDAGTTQAAPGNRVVGDNRENRSAAYNLFYTRLDYEKESTWTLILRNGTQLTEDEEAKGMHSSADRDPLGVITCTWTSEGGFSWEIDGESVEEDELPIDIVHGDSDERTMTITPHASFNLGDDTYDVMSSMADRELTNVFSAASVAPVQSIYYRPSHDNTVDEAYKLKVSYVNIADNTVINTVEATSVPEAREDLAISLPESFSKDGTEWLLIKGQGTTLYHNYYSRNKSYTVYYRDVNDEENEDAEVNTVETVTTTRSGTRAVRATPTASTRTSSTTSTTSTTTSTSTTIDDEADDTKEDEKEDKSDDEKDDETDADADQAGLGNEELHVVTTDDDSTLVNNEGTDLTTESIEDEAGTPLGLIETEDEENDSPENNIVMIVCLVLGSVLAVAIAFFLHRSRQRLGISEDGEFDDIDSDE